ncbi:hypothetical protein RND81_07G022400 [Saponaria officinalis]|uniref:Uncharacterized protein n=1 Tax=Saponaria officinalis TaxID=3572 RepID=A0AAW1JMV9_SAPOF
MLLGGDFWSHNNRRLLVPCFGGGHEASSTVEPVISPVILKTWASHVADPFISINAIGVLEAIKSVPGCIQPLVSGVLPYIGPILNHPKQQPDGLVAGSLDLVTMLLKCPTQPFGTVLCGYYVCRYMLDLIKGKYQTVLPNAAPVVCACGLLAARFGERICRACCMLVSSLNFFSRFILLAFFFLSLSNEWGELYL